MSVKPVYSNNILIMYIVLHYIPRENDFAPLCRFILQLVASSRLPLVPSGHENGTIHTDNSIYKCLQYFFGKIS